MYVLYKSVLFLHIWQRYKAHNVSRIENFIYFVKVVTLVTIEIARRSAIIIENFFAIGEYSDTCR
jgi:hypothetical protein